METTRLLVCLAVALATVAAVTATAEPTLYHGCASVSLSAGDYVVLRTGSNVPCNQACGGSGYDYDLYKRQQCVDTPLGLPADFCADEYIEEGVYEVESIGSGCTGTPNGCIRLIACE
jgi:hypothetical protein